MIYAEKKFRHYLLGNTCVFHVDQQDLVYIVNKVILVVKIARWMLILQEFDFAIQHTLGQANAVANFLSIFDKNESIMEVFDILTNARLFSVTHPDENN